MYASANIEFGFQSAFKGTGGSGWFKVRFRASRLSPASHSFSFSFFFRHCLLPHFCGQRDASQRDLVCDKRVYTRLTSESARAGSLETMSILQTEKHYLPTVVITRPDQRGMRIRARFLRVVCAEHTKGKKRITRMDRRRRIERHITP